MVAGASLLLAIESGVSRIADNKHHASDVIWGTIIGAFIAVVIVSWCLACMHHENCSCLLVFVYISAGFLAREQEIRVFLKKVNIVSVPVFIVFFVIP